jgi:hypothetical protein
VGQLNNDQIVGIILIVLGALMLFGGLSGLLLTIVAIGLVVVGILILMRHLKGPAWLGVTCLVIGILAILPNYGPVERAVHDVLGIVVVIIAVLLIVLGIMKLIQRP